jgi:hypothetical protein
MYQSEIKQKAQLLRKEGKTFSEICNLLKVKITKSTLSEWCKSIPLPLGYQRKVKEYNLFTLKKARAVSAQVAKIKWEKRIAVICHSCRHFPKLLQNIDIAKIALSILYLGEGFKDPKRGSISFGNSDLRTVKLFLHLLRHCYNIDESKFRATVQCRADQDIQFLENYWSYATKIPLSQFYKAQVDPRTVGKPSKKPEYKGVLRIDYFSADILLELLEIPKILMGL